MKLNTPTAILIGLTLSGCQMLTGGTSNQRYDTQSKWVNSNLEMNTLSQLSKDSGECNMLAMDKYKKVSVEVVVYSENCLNSRGWRKQ